MKAYAIVSKNNEAWMEESGRFAIFETKKAALLEKKHGTFDGEAKIIPITIKLNHSSRQPLIR